jgi:DNA-binding SARP family transcriptional activator
MQLLKWFLLNPSQSVSRDDLCALLWPGHEKESAINSLHVSLHYLRQLLEPESPAGNQSTFICRNRHNYYWFNCGDLWWTDVLEVQNLSAAAMDADSRGEDARAISLYGQLIGYYRLTFLPEDIYEDVFTSYRHEHDIAYVRSLNRLMHLYLRSDQLASALSCALDAARIDPYSHDVAKTIAQVHARQGDIAGAVGQLDDFFRTLERDMGTTPDDELLALRDALVAKQVRDPWPANLMSHD